MKQFVYEHRRFDDEFVNHEYQLFLQEYLINYMDEKVKTIDAKLSKNSSCNDIDNAERVAGIQGLINYYNQWCNKRDIPTFTLVEVELKRNLFGSIN